MPNHCTCPLSSTTLLQLEALAEHLLGKETQNRSTMSLTWGSLCSQSSFPPCFPHSLPPTPAPSRQAQLSQELRLWSKIEDKRPRPLCPDSRSACFTSVIGFTDKQQGIKLIRKGGRESSFVHKAGFIWRSSFLCQQRALSFVSCSKGRFIPLFHNLSAAKPMSVDF